MSTKELAEEGVEGIEVEGWCKSNGCGVLSNKVGVCEGVEVDVDEEEEAVELGELWMK